MSETLFQKTPKTVNISAEQEVVEQLTKSCQRLDLYLNSTPGDERCFITRKEIAEARENTPLFEMAKSLGDPVLIKNNVNKIAQPLLQCLRAFVDFYNNERNKTTEFPAKLLALAEIANNAYWLAVKQELQDADLLKVVASVREKLLLECEKFGLKPKQQDPLTEIKSDFLSRVGFAFQGNQEKQRQREAVYSRSCGQFSEAMQQSQQRALPTAKVG